MSLIEIKEPVKDVATHFILKIEGEIKKAHGRWDIKEPTLVVDHLI